MTRSKVHARQRGSAWYVRVCYRGERIERRVEGATTQAEAERAGRAMLADLEAGRTEPGADRVTVAELWDDLCRDYRVREQREADLAKRWRHLSPAFGRDRAAEVTTARLRRYVERRLAAGAARATVRLELAALRRCLRLAHEAGRLVRAPAFPAVSVSNTRTGFVDAAGLERLLAELPAEQRVLATLAAWLGWRRSELLGLEWRSVDLETGEVRLDVGRAAVTSSGAHAGAEVAEVAEVRTKNGDGRVAFLPPEALAALREWRAATLRAGIVSRWVVHRGGERLRGGYDAWRSACRRAGLEGLMLHDLRRTAARSYVRSGVPEHVVMRVLGHRTRSMLDRYNIVSERDLREAAARVAV